MIGCPRILRYSSLTHGIWGLLVALMCVTALVGCSGDDTTVTQTLPTATTGSLNVKVKPASATVVVTGPEAFTQTFTGNQLLTDLAPGVYSATATATGFVDTAGSINIVAAQTSSLSLNLRAAPTTGSLNVNVNPASATVVVTGPGAFTQTFTGNQFITTLTPGQYTATATATGFVGGNLSINVVVGETSVLSLVLNANAIITEAPRAVYRVGEDLVPLSPTDVQSGTFSFYAWVENLTDGISTTAMEANTIATDPGAPLLTEQTETAPSFTQNLAGAWVGFTDADGVVRPVIGADVRWEIDQLWTGRNNSMQFGTSDDNRLALDYGVFDDQADTRTNNARLENERFPLIAAQYPLFNLTGIGTPNVDGFTWVTLFSPDNLASGRIVAVATLNGEEIGKQILYKTFAPVPQIEITKTVDTDVVNLVDGSATATWTLTVKNVGTGDATNVDLSDTLISGAGASYTLGALPDGSLAVDDGFTSSFPLVSAYATAPAPVADQTAQLLGNAQSFAVLASSTVTNTGSSVITGNVGLSPGSAVIGFPPAITLDGTIHISDAPAIAAQTALTTAYVDLGARECTADLTGQDLGGMTLVPGVYCFSTSAQLTGPLVLNAEGDAAAEFIFKTGSTLTTASSSSVSLINGASPCNVYWQIGSSATLGSSTFFVGNILAQASVTAGNGASISGRALARTGAVTLDTNAITAPLSCVAAPAAPPTPPTPPTYPPTPPTPPAEGSVKTMTVTATVTAPGTYCNEAQIPSYNSATGTYTPADLKAQACFTALESNLSIVKDFVADDNTTSLGHSLTVAANVPAKLRVRVINNGGGAATGVSVNDALDGGTDAAYQFISVAPGTPNANDGFDTSIGDLAAGSTSTMLLTVSASADGTYCDTASVTATSGAIGVGSDSACLTVATPNLTISKTNAPLSVIPSGSYTSTILVENTGTATATGVVISDLIGLNAVSGIRVIYVSSSLNGVGGTLASNTITANSVNILAGESLTFTVVSQIPPGAISGTYCDTASVTSTNAPSPAPVEACVDVPAFVALQTQLIDLADPIAVGSDVDYSSVLYVETLSNEGVKNVVLTYSFGLTSPTTLGIPGVFSLVSTQIYLDTVPIRDPITGLVLSDTANPTAVLLTEGVDYTQTTELGLQVITMTANVELHRDTALYVVHTVNVPIGTPTGHLYTTSYIWESAGLLSSNVYEASSSEPTTVLP